MAKPFSSFETGNSHGLPGVLTDDVISHAGTDLPAKARAWGVLGLPPGQGKGLTALPAENGSTNSRFSTYPSLSSGGLTPISTSSLKSSPGAGSTGTSPSSPTTTATIERGQKPWTAERVEQLVNDGTIQSAWLPDIRATAPTHLQIQNAQQREMLRFSNSIANTGQGNWQVRRGTPLSDPAQIAYAESLGLDPSELAITSQELVNKDGSLAAMIPDAAISEYHPAHRHFHIGETAEFEVDHFNAETKEWDKITGLEVVKTTFCLIDVNQIQPVNDGDSDHYDIIKSPANANLYNDCFADVQGVQAGWMDRYHHQLPGQEVDVTNLKAGIYRIVTNVNPSGWFLESDFSNNMGWTAFELSRDSNGNGHITVLPEHGGIWFTNSQNGMG